MVSCATIHVHVKSSSHSREGPCMPDTTTHVIVGAALAGAKAAEALREEGFEGRIVLIGAEDELGALLAKGSGRVAVIGAGWIGSEVAASARTKGLDVALVEMAGVPLERVLGTDVGEIYADVHRRNGVDLRLGVGIEAFEGSGRVERVKLEGGGSIDCDFAVVGVGVVPRTELAEKAGLEVGNGIQVSKRLETSVPGVFAAGDVANAFHPFYGGKLRVEHWANALNQPVTAAQAMLGKDGVSYDRLPYFFSDQYDVGMEYVGYASDWDEVVIRRDAG